MDRLFEALRRNPDAVAIAVLCLLLGNSGGGPKVRTFHTSQPAGIHWISGCAEEAGLSLLSRLNLLEAGR
jgi:hypothetical protein